MPEKKGQQNPGMVDRDALCPINVLINTNCPLSVLILKPRMPMSEDWQGVLLVSAVWFSPSLNDFHFDLFFSWLKTFRLGDMIQIFSSKNQTLAVCPSYLLITLRLYTLLYVYRWWNSLLFNQIELFKFGVWLEVSFNFWCHDN